MSDRPRTCGFRFLPTDPILILGGAAATWLLWDRLGSLAWIFAMVIGHFFLFCNVIRVRRSYELTWTAVFLANMTLWSALDGFAWWKVLAIQTPLTALLVGLELRSERYHGVFCRRINGGRIDRWLSGEIP